MERKQFTFYRSYYEAIKHLPERDKAKVLMAILSYALDDLMPEGLSGAALSVFTLIRPTLDSGRIKAQNRLNKSKTNEEQNENKTESNAHQTRKEKEREKEKEVEVEREKDILKENYKRKKFAPPSVDEVVAYCQERKNGIDAQHFVDYYASRNWMLGRVKMSDWRAAVRTWEKNGYSAKPAETSFDLDAFEAMARFAPEVDG